MHKLMSISKMARSIITRRRMTLNIKKDTQFNNTQHYDIQHNDTQHNDTQHNDTQHIDTQHRVSLC
jgi:hypothetical protein